MAYAQTVEQIARYVEKYGLSPQVIIPLRRGSNGIHYKVQCSSRQVVVVSIRPTAAEDRLWTAFHAQDHLTKAGLPSIRHLTSLQGETVLRVGDYSLVVTAYIAGRCGGPFSAVELSYIASLLATVHQLRSPSRFPKRPSLFHLTERLLKDSNVAPLELASWLRDHNWSNEGPPTDATPAGLVHGDLFADNVIITPQGPIIIDWEGAALGPLIDDIAIALIGLCMTRGVLSLTNVRIFLDGYQAVRQLATCEHNALRKSIRDAAFNLIFRRAARFTSLDGSPVSGHAPARELMHFLELFDQI
ncbi:MAG: phosphotransferase, partial [Pyrinomonadaceae bacterium]